MLKTVEIGLTVLSIFLGAYEVLGRTDVISGPTPIEAVRDAVADDPPPAPTELSTTGPAGALDLTLNVQECTLNGGTTGIAVVALSSQPTSTPDGVGVSATSGLLTNSGSVAFDNSDTSTGSTLALSLGPGTHDVTLEVDPDDLYEEADEENNVVPVLVDVPADMSSCSLGGS